MGRPHCLFGLQQVFGEPFQHLLLQQEFIHDEGWASRTRGVQFLIMKGSTSFRRFCWMLINFRSGPRLCENSLLLRPPRNSTSWVGEGCVFTSAPRGERSLKTWLNGVYIISAV